MRNFWTWRKVGIFLGIIGLGIIGLIIADQHDFMTGRSSTQTAIGNGVPDPLVSGSSSPQKIAPSKSLNSPAIDGVKKEPCPKTC